GHRETGRKILISADPRARLTSLQDNRVESVRSCHRFNRATQMQETMMATSPEHPKLELSRMKTPPVVSAQEWDAAHKQMLVKEKAMMRARDALNAERRRMPWVAVEKTYTFEGPKGKVSLLDLFEGRPQLIVYRAFFEPGVHGWPEHACIGCSLD